MKELIVYFSQNVSPSELDIPKGNLGSGAFSTILQVVFGLLAATAVIIMMIAALKYVTSLGDPQGVAKAKNTIIYAAVGLVIAASAFSIVTFVVKSL
jgi:hypothetical protein